MVFAVVERPFFAEVVAAFEHFAVGVVTVVFVAGYQSVGLVVFDHDVVAVGETAQFFAVASVNGGQIAVAVVVVTHQFLTVEGDGGEAVDVETLVFGNEDVPFPGRVEVGIVVVQTDGGEYGLEVSAAAVVNAVRQSVVVVAEADMAAVAVELGDQLKMPQPESTSANSSHAPPSGEAIWQRSSESWFSDDLYVTVNEIVKDQMIQTNSKKVLRSSEKQKPRACVPFALYIGIVGFIGYSLLIYRDCINSIYLSVFLSQKMYK